MKYTRAAGTLSFTFLLATLAFVPAAANEGDANVRFGLGVAPQYGGVGGSIQRVTDKDLWSFGVGVISFSNMHGNAVGAGISYQRADLFGVTAGEPNRHAAGLYIGAVGNETYARYSNGQWSETSNDAIWGGGVLYNYYHKGINDSDWVIGVSLTHGSGSYRDVTSGGITLGYQF